MTALLAKVRLPKWYDDARCSGEELETFFGLPEGQRDRHRPTLTIKEVREATEEFCDNCPVQQTCLEYALDNNLTHGIWGGTTGRERKLMLREQRRTA